VAEAHYTGVFIFCERMEIQVRCYSPQNYGLHVMGYPCHLPVVERMNERLDGFLRANIPLF
jgi:hypothetical protein